jgi:hypothetical protein
MSRKEGEKAHSYSTSKKKNKKDKDEDEPSIQTDISQAQNQMGTPISSMRIPEIIRLTTPPQQQSASDNLNGEESWQPKELIISQNQYPFDEGPFSLFESIQHVPFDEDKNTSAITLTKKFEKSGFHLAFVGYFFMFELAIDVGSEILAERYVLLEQIALGGSASFWLAKDLKHALIVGIKIHRNTENHQQNAEDEVIQRHITSTPIDRVLDSHIQAI